MTSIQTFVDLDDETVFVGALHSTLRRGNLASSLVYDETYLARQDSYALEPGLPLRERNLSGFGALPGSFMDASPDRWGRLLIQKRQRFENPATLTTPGTLDERDYLLSVNDETRQGALRFRTSDSEDFLSHAEGPVPALIELPALLRASEQYASEHIDVQLEAVKFLLNAGSATLGGARPKASVRNSETLYIAKFPHHTDEFDVMAWEKTALDLAEAAGISVPKSQLVPVSGKNVLLLERFDRRGKQRIGYISAMTLLESRDGRQRDYLELAEAMALNCYSPTQDLRELWSRILFSIVINNTDDHLRNHGFLRRENGWNLSPVFDINPNINLNELRSTSIANAASKKQEFAALFDSIAWFGLSLKQAHDIAENIRFAVSQWHNKAQENGISSNEIGAFQHVFVTGLELFERRLSQLD